MSTKVKPLRIDGVRIWMRDHGEVPVRTLSGIFLLNLISFFLLCFGRWKLFSYLLSTSFFFFFSFLHGSNGFILLFGFGNIIELLPWLPTVSHGKITKGWGVDQQLLIKELKWELFFCGFKLCKKPITQYRRSLWFGFCSPAFWVIKRRIRVPSNYGQLHWAWRVYWSETK